MTPVPINFGPFFRRAVALLLGMALGISAHAAHGPKPAPSQRIPLDGTGYQPAAPDILLAKGFSMDTLHFVGDHYLLFTFNPRVLVPRPPDDPSTHDDQIVDGVLLELPSGKIVARTRWQMHDHGQYLWPMGPGRFLLRQGQVLSLLQPEANLHKHAPLQLLPLMTLPGKPASIDISPNGTLLAAQTLRISANDAQTDTTVSSPVFSDLSRAQALFTRLGFAEPEPGTVVLNELGYANLNAPVALSVNATGSLQSEFISQNIWRISLMPFSDARRYLGYLSSTCHPRFTFLSEEQALVSICRGSEQALTLAALTMDGLELWEQNFSEQHTALHLLAQPAAGRFAMSRVLTNAPVTHDVDLDPDRATAEEVLVFDMRTGEIVMQTTALPMEIAAQNYALSTDGSKLAVLKNMTLEIYNLPPQPQNIAKLAGYLPNHPVFTPISAEETAALQKADKAVADEAKKAAAEEDARRKAAMPDIYSQPAKTTSDTAKPGDNSGNQTSQQAAIPDANPDKVDPMQNLQIVPDTPPK